MKIVDLSDKELPQDDNDKSIVYRKRPGTMSYTTKISVEDIASYLPEGKALSLTDEERKNLEVSLKRMSRGLMYTGVTVCPALDSAQYGKCTFFAECPFSETQKPYGSRCPIEMAYVHKWFDEYVEQLDIDIHNRTEVSMAERLAMIDLEEAKAYKALAVDGFEEQKVTKSEDGVSIERKLHNAVEYIDKLEKRKMSIFKSLAATRDSKNKEMSGDKLSASEILSKLQNKLKQ
jgi:hypothetical protein